MIQLVVSGNRIVAHGEDCFLSMCGTVVCTATGRVFQNATVVNHDGAIPSDIDSVGYEYHAGDFVPCAPYGKGTGTLAVVCDECGTIKDSGVSVSNICKVIEKEYEGTGGSGSLELDGIYPLFVEIREKMDSDDFNGTQCSGVITRRGGHSVKSYISNSMGATNTQDWAAISSYMDGNTLHWRCAVGGADMCLNEKGAKYIAVVVGLEVDSNG